LTAVAVTEPSVSLSVKLSSPALIAAASTSALVA